MQHRTGMKIIMEYTVEVATSTVAYPNQRDTGRNPPRWDISPICFFSFVGTMRLRTNPGPG